MYRFTLFVILAGLAYSDTRAQDFPPLSDDTITIRSLPQRPDTIQQVGLLEQTDPVELPEVLEPTDSVELTESTEQAEFLEPTDLFQQSDLLEQSDLIEHAGFRCGQTGCKSRGGCCNNGCGDDGCGECCRLPFWTHRNRVFADWLFLRAREQNVDFATPVDGTTNTAVPVGQTAVLDPGFESGIRIGAGIAIDQCSSLTFAWTHFESDISRATQLPGGAPFPNTFLRSELTHPNTLNVGADSLFSGGRYDIDFQFADIAITRTLKGDNCQRLNGTVGFRYANLEQDLRAQHRILDDISIQSDIDFDGYGPRLGLDYERRNCSGFLVYSRGGISLLAGRFDADFLQSSVFTGTQAKAGIFEDRIVPEYELELGAGWQNCEGTLRFTAGYLLNIWGNVLTTPGFIDGMQANELDDIDETLTFAGLTVRAEVLY